MKRYRDNIMIAKLEMFKKATLPNGRTFYSKCKRVRINLLHTNARIRRGYRRKERNIRQGCSELKDVLENGFNLAKRAAKSKIGGSLPKKAIENLPKVYQKDVSKIKNQKLQIILNSDLTNMMLNYGQANTVDQLDIRLIFYYYYCKHVYRTCWNI